MKNGAVVSVRMEGNSAEDLEAISKEIEGADTKNTQDQEWKTVSYKKKKKKSKLPTNNKPPDQITGSSDVFRSMSEDRRQPVVKPEKAADDGIDAPVVTTELKKKKKKKKEKVKIGVAEAASKINDSDLAVFLADISESYEESQADIRLMRLADYFGRVFASSEFLWIKEASSVDNMIHIPLSQIPEDVSRTAADWLNRQPVDALGSFVLWSLDIILADLPPPSSTKASTSNKVVLQHPPSKSQVAIFVVLAMLLRRKPDVLINLLPLLKDSSKYQGHDKLPVLLWTITQACEGDLVVGLFMWVHLLLPVVCNKSGCNPQSRDLILQLIERIASSPKARIILINGAVRKGERVVSPPALELLMGSTFPASAARVKATERFEAVYPLLKDVALAVAPGSKAMKQLTQQLLPIAAKAAGQGKSALASEASDIFIWCLTQSPDCYKQWGDIYVDNLEASIVFLRKLSDEWKMHSSRHSSLEPLKAALKSFRDKNEQANGGVSEALFKDADKHCRIILAKFSRVHGCLKATAFLTITMAVGMALVIKDPRVWNLKELVDFDLSRTFTSLLH